MIRRLSTAELLTPRGSTSRLLSFRRSPSQKRLKQALKTVPDFKWEDYVFNFTNAIKIPALLNLLKEYLKGELNCEPLEFLDDIAAYKVDVIAIHKKFSEKSNQQQINGAVSDVYSGDGGSPVTSRGMENKRKSLANLNFRAGSFRPQRNNTSHNLTVDQPSPTAKSPTSATSTTATVDKDFGEVIDEEDEEGEDDEDEDEEHSKPQLATRSMKGVMVPKLKLTPQTPDDIIAEQQEEQLLQKSSPTLTSKHSMKTPRGFKNLESKLHSFLDFGLGSPTKKSSGTGNSNNNINNNNNNSSSNNLSSNNLSRGKMSFDASSSSSLDGGGAMRPMSLDQYRKITEQVLAKAKRIVDTYLTDASIKEINVSAEAKRCVREAFEKMEEEYWRIVNNDDDIDSISLNAIVIRTHHFNLFSAVEQPLKVELAQDVFPRFIRSGLFRVFVLEQDVDFLNQIATKRDQDEIRKVFYSLEDWLNPVITDQDIDLMHMLVADSPDWVHIYTTKQPLIQEQTSVYFNFRNFIVGDNIPKHIGVRQLTKMVFYVPYSPMQCFESSLSLEFRYVSEETLVQATHLEYLSADPQNGRKYATSLNRYRMDFSGGLSKRLISLRDLYMYAVCIVDPKNPKNLCCIVRDANIETNKEKNVVRGSIYLVFYFEHVSDNLTRMTSIYSTNMGGYMKSMSGKINEMFMKDLYKRRAKSMRDGLIQALQIREKAGWPIVTESMGNVEGLIENMRLYVPTSVANFHLTHIKASDQLDSLTIHLNDDNNNNNNNINNNNNENNNEEKMNEQEQQTSVDVNTTSSSIVEETNVVTDEVVLVVNCE